MTAMGASHAVTRRSTSSRRITPVRQPERVRACPGYVIDHIQPLKRGGADEPWNMQWQTVQDAKAEDRTE